MKTRWQYKLTLWALWAWVVFFFSGGCSTLRSLVSEPYSNWHGDEYRIDFLDSQSVWTMAIDAANITGVYMQPIAPPEPFTVNRARRFCETYLEMDFVSLEPNGWVVVCRRV